MRIEASRQRRRKRKHRFPQRLDGMNLTGCGPGREGRPPHRQPHRRCQLTRGPLVLLVNEATDRPRDTLRPKPNGQPLRRRVVAEVSHRRMKNAGSGVDREGQQQQKRQPRPRRNAGPGLAAFCAFKGQHVPPSIGQLHLRGKCPRLGCRSAPSGGVQGHDLGLLCAQAATVRYPAPDQISANGRG